MLEIPQLPLTSSVMTACIPVLKLNLSSVPTFFAETSGAAFQLNKMSGDVYLLRRRTLELIFAVYNIKFQEVAH